MCNGDGPIGGMAVRKSGMTMPSSSISWLSQLQAGTAMLESGTTMPDSNAFSYFFLLD